MRSASGVPQSGTGSPWSVVKARVPFRYRYAARNVISLVRTGRLLPHESWAIGIYKGTSPLTLEPLPHNPILTGKDVTDVKASFVADPFMILSGDRWHMFFEVWNRASGRGEIGLATSPDGTTWAYDRIVLAEPYHLSYPYVFEREGQHFMLPETHQDRSVRLYRAAPFPSAWVPSATLLEGRNYKDASLLQHDGRWWMFVETSPGIEFDTLSLFVADDLLGPWREHPASPIVSGDAAIARPAGRPFIHDGAVVRLAQDCATEYGRAVSAFRVTTLTPEEYQEEGIGTILAPSPPGWNGKGMHHADLHQGADGQWLACVDGRS